MDVTRRGVDWLHEKRKQNLVESVVYRRGTLSETLDATILRAGSVSEEFGLIIDSREQDFLVDFSDMAYFGFGEPLRGDEVTRTVDGTEITYEVAGRDGEPPARPADRYRQAWRIHTNRLEIST
jgi:hypothetical protein